MSELKLYQKTYGFLVCVFAKTDGFPKWKRFSMGQRLESLFLDLIAAAYAAAREVTSSQRHPAQQPAHGQPRGAWP